jgi:hypothetical protein
VCVSNPLRLFFGVYPTRESFLACIHVIYIYNMAVCNGFLPGGGETHSGGMPFLFISL